MGHGTIRSRAVPARLAIYTSYIYRILLFVFSYTWREFSTQYQTEQEAA
jgi:hypothetical protein